MNDGFKFDRQDVIDFIRQINAFKGGLFECPVCSGIDIFDSYNGKGESLNLHIHCCQCGHIMQFDSNTVKVAISKQRSKKELLK